MPESTDKSNKTTTVKNDQPTPEDTLGFTPYVVAMAEFLTHPETKPPLTLSIEGEWGSGKSSFMKQLEDQIKKKSEELEEEQLKEIWARLKKEHITSNLSDISQFLKLKLKLSKKTQTIWFNAWRHDKSESLWAAFALSFLEQISTNRSLSDILPNLWGYLKLISNRFNALEKPVKFIQTLAISSLLFSIIIAIPIVYFRVGIKGVSLWSEQVENLLKKESTKADNNQEKDSNKTSNKDADNSLLTIILIIGGTGASVSGIGKLLATLRDLIGDPKMDLTQYLESPDYNSQIAFIEKFHQDFCKIVDAYAGKGEKVYVFIDDIDRCELGKSADLLQTLNLMISNDPNLIFILGMDREKVAAAITFKHKDVLPYLASISVENQDKEKENDKSISVENQDKEQKKDKSLKELDYGFSFMEKFVQLSFSVPKPSEKELDIFLKKISQNKKENSQEKRFFWTPLVLSIIKISKIVKIILEQFIPGNRKAEEETKTQNLPDTNPEVKTDPDLAIFPIIEKDLTSESLAHIIEMVAPFFDYNPRRLKQYINALRLQTYIAYYVVGVPYAEKGLITPEQLGKFVALTLKYPRLLFELKKNDELLAEYENCALGKSEESKDRINNDPKLKKLLCYGLNIELSNQYSLNNKSLKKLLQVSCEIPSKYLQLREFVANQKWKEADKETYRLMLQVAGREDQGWLHIEDIDNFPCEDLRTIDQLWVKYSQGHFGFSVQKEIYFGLGGTREYNEKVWQKFGDQVGWRKGGEWSPYEFYFFELRDTTPDGHLPTINVTWEVFYSGILYFEQGFSEVGQQRNNYRRFCLFSSMAYRLVSCSAIR